MKKAQSISINTIIVAAIALLVLVVILAIFGNKLKLFNTETRSCVTQGGEKCDTKEKCPAGEYVYLPGTECDDQNKKAGITPTDAGYKYCCKKILG